LDVDQFFRERPHQVNIAAEETNVHLHVAANGPTQARKCPRERRERGLSIVFAKAREHADPP